MPSTCCVVGHRPSHLQEARELELCNKISQELGRTAIEADLAVRREEIIEVRPYQRHPYHRGILTTEVSLPEVTLPEVTLPEASKLASELACGTHIRWAKPQCIAPLSRDLSRVAFLT